MIWVALLVAFWFGGAVCMAVHMVPMLLSIHDQQHPLMQELEQRGWAEKLRLFLRLAFMAGMWPVSIVEIIRRFRSPEVTRMAKLAFDATEPKPQPPVDPRLQ